MKKDLMEADNLRQSAVKLLSKSSLRLKLAEPPDRDRIQRVVDLADALLSEAETLARDKAFTEEATRLKPLDILGGINFYDEVQRFEIHLIKMALSETGGNQAKAARLLGIKATTLNSKIKLFCIEVDSAPQTPKRKHDEGRTKVEPTVLRPPRRDEHDRRDVYENGEGLTEVELTVLRLLHSDEQDRRAVYNKGPLRLCIDGKESLRCLVSEGLFTCFRVPIDSEYVEVFGQDGEGEFLLGVFAFAETDIVTECEGKQRVGTHEIGNCVELSIYRVRDNALELEYLLEVSYRKTTDSEQ